MAGEKSPQLKEQELLEERAKLIGEHIKSNPDLVDALRKAREAEERGEGMPAGEYFEKRGITSV